MIKLLERRAYGNVGREAANARKAIIRSLLLICWYDFSCEEGIGQFGAAPTCLADASSKVRKGLESMPEADHRRRKAERTESTSVIRTMALTPSGGGQAGAKGRSESPPWLSSSLRFCPLRRCSRLP